MSNQSDLAKSAAGFNGDPLSIDTANNRVGIGTSSIPAEARAMVSGGRFYVNSQDQYSVLLQNSGTSGGFIGTTAANTINFFNPAGTERMRIDSAGCVTMPYQPAFNVYRTTDPGTASSYTKMNWEGSRFNRGNHFNMSNSRFVAPVAGVYWFGITNNQGSGQSVDSWRIYKNGSSMIIISYDDNSTSWNNTSASLILSLSTNDYIEFWWRGDPDFGYDWCNAYGYLVG